MSSRLVRANDPRPVEPMAWRAVESGGSVSALFPPGNPSASPAENAELERQIELRLREAHAAGLREGEAAGRSRASAELQPVIDRLGRSIEEIGGLRARLRRDAERDLVRLALAIAKRILRRELAVDPDAMHGLVLGALEKLQSQEINRVRVHPSHAVLVTACLQKVVNGPAAQVVADPSCEPGAVVFETERGSLDASVESQLQEIERGLADRLRKHP